MKRGHVKGVVKSLQRVDLDMIPNLIQFLQRAGFKLFALPFHFNFEGFEARGKAVCGLSQRLRGVHSQKPGQIDRGQQEITQFPSGLLGVFCFQRCLNLPRLLLDFLQDTFRVRPVKSQR